MNRDLIIEMVAAQLYDDQIPEAEFAFANDRDRNFWREQAERLIKHLFTVKMLSHFDNPPSKPISEDEKVSLMLQEVDDAAGAAENIRRSGFLSRPPDQTYGITPKVSDASSCSSECTHG